MYSFNTLSPIFDVMNIGMRMIILSLDSNDVFANLFDADNGKLVPLKNFSFDRQFTSIHKHSGFYVALWADKKHISIMDSTLHEISVFSPSNETEFYVNNNMIASLSPSQLIDVYSIKKVQG